MRMWMIRHSDQTFSRPIPETSLIAKIESGELDRSDELCASGEYWFSLQDVSEVRRFLGEIRLDAILTPPRDSTSTTLSGQSPFRSGADPELTPVPKAGREAIPSVKSGPAEPLAAPLKTAVSQPQRPARQVPASPVRRGWFSEPEEIAPLPNQVLFVLVLLFIFFGTVYLLWVYSR